jgi:hypothetical protein
VPKYRLSHLRLTVKTYGDKDVVKALPSPTLLAQSLSIYPQLEPALAAMQKDWRSGDIPLDAAEPGEFALEEAHDELSRTITTVLKRKAVVEGSQPVYKPVYDKFGNLVGHDTVSSLLVDGSPVIFEELTRDGGKISFGMIAMVSLAVEPQ